MNKVNDLKFIEEHFPEVLNGIGKLFNRAVKLYINSNIMPGAQKHRKIPFHLRDKLEKRV